jgi:hypothetical protein
MRKIIFAIAVFLLCFGSAQHLYAQLSPKVKVKTLTEGDTTYYAYLGANKGDYKMSTATLYNPDDGLTDSVEIYHVIKFDGTADSVFKRVGFKKWDVTAEAVQNDTVYYLIVLAPGESIDILIWRAYPDGIFWRLSNAEYSADRILRIKNRFSNY